MKRLFHMVIVAALAACFTVDAQVTSTTGAVLIRTNFVAGASLTENEIKTIVKLAKACGISQVAEIKTFARQPPTSSTDYGILVIGGDQIRGREDTYLTLEVFRDGWGPFVRPSGPLQSVSEGQFWVRGIGVPESHHCTLFVTSRGRLRVQVDPGIPLRVADRIVKAVTTSKIQYSSEFVYTNAFRAENVAELSRIGVSEKDSSGQYWIGFLYEDSKYFLTLKGNDVVLVSAAFIVH